MKQSIFLIMLCMALGEASANTWCTARDFNVVVAGNYVAIEGSTLSADGKPVYIGDIRTERGKAIQSLLMAAALADKPVKYGDNNMSYACGELPTYSSETVSPGYLYIMTKD